MPPCCNRKFLWNLQLCGSELALAQGISVRITTSLHERTDGMSMCIKRICFLGKPEQPDRLIRKSSFSWATEMRFGHITYPAGLHIPNSLGSHLRALPYARPAYSLRGGSSFSLGQHSVSIRRFFRNFCAFFSRLRKSNGDCLLSAFDDSSFSPFSRSQRSMFSSTHCTLDRLARCSPISGHDCLLISDQSLARCLSSRP